ncbi:hypothetical protein T03_13454 [Trichinella britovi]|uniref:Uncharacterized protein n=1 Tax=Trichinella britovi TaxID=45882 RepID=A0A0V1AVR5_TRIBR|nr:hypothetical protein T03_13454 [Trichinella britovi]
MGMVSSPRCTFLHFDDNSTELLNREDYTYDRYFKIQSVLNMLLKRLK